VVAVSLSAFAVECVTNAPMVPPTSAATSVKANNIFFVISILFSFSSISPDENFLRRAQ